MAVPTQAQIAALEAAVRAATTDVASKAAVCNLATYREMVWRGQASPGLLDDGINGGDPDTGYPQGAFNNAYMGNR
jgi:hypothetical protein